MYPCLKSLLKKKSSRPNKSFKPDLSPKSQETTAKQDSHPPGSEDILILKKWRRKPGKKHKGTMNCLLEKD